MNTHVIVIETGYKTASANYKIRPLDPMDEEAARSLFAELIEGTRPDLLPEKKHTQVLEVTENQFLRLHRNATRATILDRVTLTRIH